MGNNFKNFNAEFAFRSQVVPEINGNILFGNHRLAFSFAW